MEMKPIAMYALADGILDEEVRMVSNTVKHYMGKVMEWEEGLDAPFVVLCFKMTMNDNKMHWFLAACAEQEGINPDEIDLIIQGVKIAISSYLIDGIFDTISKKDRTELAHTMHYLNMIVYRYTKVEDINPIYEGIMAWAKEKGKRKGN